MFVIKSINLGSNCWLPIRFMGECYKCERFDICKYDEKFVHPKAQAGLDRIKEIREEKKRLEERINVEKNKLGI